jgi:universal stress protein E
VRTVRRILVAIKDPALHGSAAVIKAAQLARAFRAELQLFHAITTSYVDIYGLSDTTAGENERDMRARIIKQLEAGAALLRHDDDLSVTTAAEWDFPAYESILRQARRIEADLIVAEPHAGHRFAPLVLHPTDWELLRLSPVPVLLIKTRQAYRRPVILAAVDPAHAHAKPSALDTEILTAASMLSSALDGELHGMHAYLTLPRGLLIGDVGDPRKQEREARIAAKARFDRVLRSTGIPQTRRHLVFNSADEGIRAVAKGTDSAIVVMGAVSRSGLKRLFIGNTAERTLDHLDCDVLIVKPREFVSRLTPKSRGPRRSLRGPRLPV